MKNKDPNDTIILVNKKHNKNENIINQGINSISIGDMIIYSKDLNQFDFTKINIDSFIIFRGEMMKNYNSDKRFTSILELQKFIIEHAIGNKYEEILCMSDKKYLYKAETNGDKVLRKSKPRKPNRRSQTDEEIKKHNKPLKIKRTKKINEKPKILILSDVKGWAW